jgi:hypothetical protein
LPPLRFVPIVFLHEKARQPWEAPGG